MNKQANSYKSEESQPKSQKTRVATRQMQSFLDGSFLAKGSFASFIPFIIFLAVLGLIYIKNNYTAERNIRVLNKLNQELIELHYDYIQMKSVVNLKTQPSTLEGELETFGIKRLERPPTKLFIEP
ncbi:MAG: hypothetical protein IH598_04450 [Bacteroidales bacterium]|nr:hypothetical protein [Bacteroidales bacterium]